MSNYKFSAFNSLGIMVWFFAISVNFGESYCCTKKIWRLGNRLEIIEDRGKNRCWILWRPVSSMQHVEFIDLHCHILPLCLHLECFQWQGIVEYILVRMLLSRSLGPSIWITLWRLSLHRRLRFWGNYCFRLLKFTFKNPLVCDNFSGNCWNSLEGDALSRVIWEIVQVGFYGNEGYLILISRLRKWLKFGR